MESSIEVSQTKPKPSLAPKPLLAPKPFSLQKNTCIRHIHAPKLIRATSKATAQQSLNSAATVSPTPTLPTPASQPTTSKSTTSTVSAPTKEQPEITKASPHGENNLDSSVGKSEPAPKTAPPKEKPKSIAPEKDDIIQTNHKTSTDVVTKLAQKDDETQTSVNQNIEESGSDVSSATSPASKWGSTRKRLSMELTSKFESGGVPLPPQPSVTTHTTSTKSNANKPESLKPEQSRATPEPPASDDGGLKEDYTSGNSIKRRISLLFDSRPEVSIRREEPEMLNGTGGVKQRIKNWVTETSSECPKTEKPPFVPRRHKRSASLFFIT